MRNSKLIKSLSNLNEKEMDAFHAFVASPYFNKNNELLAFLELILAEDISGGGDMDKNLILSKLFPGKTYQERWLPDLMYGLMNLLEDFLAEEKYRQNKFQRKINLMMLAYEKDLEPVINGIERDLEQLHIQNPVRDSNYFYESFMIHSERDYSFRLSGKITENESLQAKADQLDLFYLSLKLKDSCEMLNRSRIVSAHYDFKMVDTVIAYLQAHPDAYQQYPAIQVYLYYYLMLTDAAHEKYFFELKELIQNSELVFTRDELRSLYTYLQNYSIRRINQGGVAFNEELFQIYKHIFGNGLVFGDNKNMQWDFKNFVSLGLRMKEFDWTLNIINVFKDHLPETSRDNAYSYNLANYYYETGEYKKATKLLNAVEFTEIFYSLDAKAMLLKIYYKVEEEESFYSLVSSFGIYLRRNKLISKDNAEVYSNLLRFTKKAFLLKTKLPYERKKDYYRKVSLLKQDIHHTQRIMNINWLLQEVEALEG